VELLVMIVITAILAGLLLPALGRAKGSSKRSMCLSNLRQVGLGFAMYSGEHADRLPDRRDLKLELGFMTWTTWPPSDPRSGWAASTLKAYVPDPTVWRCPSLQSSPLANAPQCNQAISMATNAPIAQYWLWRFDHIDADIPLDNFWGKTEEQSVSDLKLANNPQAGIPSGAVDVELAVDPYFPQTIAALPGDLRGRAVHPNGRNRLFLDGHVSFLRDARTR
jgi:prepilin-type processing-associated H-X9-DG protein